MIIPVRLNDFNQGNMFQADKFLDLLLFDCFSRRARSNKMRTGKWITFYAISLKLEISTKNLIGKAVGKT